MRLLPRILELKPEAAARAASCRRSSWAPPQAAVEALEASHPHARGRIELVDRRHHRPGPRHRRRSAARELRRSLRAGLAPRRRLRPRGRPRRGPPRSTWRGRRTSSSSWTRRPHFERLQYVSTAYVSGTARGTFRETDLDVGQGFKNHYEETKFQAEVEVVRSKVPHTIYRPGVVVGDSRTGETGEVRRALLRPAGDGEAARRPASSSGSASASAPSTSCRWTSSSSRWRRSRPRPAALGKTYHLCDPQPHSPGELAEMFAEAIGKTFAYVPVPLAVARAFFAPKPVQRFFGMPLQALDYFDDPVRHDTTQATAGPRRARASSARASPTTSRGSSPSTARTARRSARKR